MLAFEGRERRGVSNSDGIIPPIIINSFFHMLPCPVSSQSLNSSFPTCLDSPDSFLLSMEVRRLVLTNRPDGVYMAQGEVSAPNPLLGRRIIGLECEWGLPGIKQSWQWPLLYGEGGLSGSNVNV